MIAFLGHKKYDKFNVDTDFTPFQISTNFFSLALLFDIYFDNALKKLEYILN